MLRLLGRFRAVSFHVVALLAFLSTTAAVSHAQTLTTTATLLWTATGDNGTAGQAAKYDLRYTANALSANDTLSWWNKALLVNMSTHKPPPSGTKDSVVISGLVIGKKYYAMLRIADSAGNWSGFSNIATIDLTRGVTAVEGEVGAPKLVIGAPYPSPTSGAARVAITLARSGPLQADVFDARGRRVRTLYSGSVEAGRHELRWDGFSDGSAQAAAGVYWIRVSTQGVQKSMKLIVIR